MTTGVACAWMCAKISDHEKTNILHIIFTDRGETKTIAKRTINGHVEAGMMRKNPLFPRKLKFSHLYPFSLFPCMVI